MSPEAVIALVLQTVIILIGIGASFIRSRERITRVEERCAHIERNTEGLKEDHKQLAEKVNGISRHVGIIEGRLKEKDVVN